MANHPMFHRNVGYQIPQRWKNRTSGIWRSEGCSYSSCARVRIPQPLPRPPNLITELSTINGKTSGNNIFFFHGKTELDTVNIFCFCLRDVMCPYNVHVIV